MMSSKSNTKDPATIEVNNVTINQQKSSLWRRVLSFVWDSADGDLEYRRYVRRLDLGLLYDTSILEVTLTDKE